MRKSQLRDELAGERAALAEEHRHRLIWEREAKALREKNTNQRQIIQDLKTGRDGLLKTTWRVETYADPGQDEPTSSELVGPLKRDEAIHEWEHHKIRAVSMYGERAQVKLIRIDEYLDKPNLVSLAENVNRLYQGLWSDPKWYNWSNA